MRKKGRVSISEGYRQIYISLRDVDKVDDTVVDETSIVAFDIKNGEIVGIEIIPSKHTIKNLLNKLKNGEGE